MKGRRVMKKFSLASAFMVTLLTGCAGQTEPPAMALEAPAEEDNGGRIVGGELAAPGTAPWQVQIYSTAKYSAAEIAADRKLKRGDPNKIYLDERQGYQLTHRCGGSYIGNGWIVTAAHCVVLKSVAGQTAGGVLANRLIKLGTQDLRAGGATYPIEMVVIHKGYSRERPVDDIALIRIRQDAKLASLLAQNRLAPIALHKPADGPLFDEETLRVTGWGYTGAMTDVTAPKLDRQNNTQINPAELQQVSVNYLANANCASVPQYRKFWNSRFVCAGSLSAEKDACVGDSGGPLTRVQNKKRVLVGVVSIGVGCAFRKIPGAYMRVSSYQKWIAAAQAVTRKGVTYLPEPTA